MSNPHLKHKHWWAPIPGYERRYAVSTHGQVKSLPDHQVLRDFMGWVRLHHADGGVEPRAIGELVLLAFRGPAPEGGVLTYRDRNEKNARLTNVYYRIPRKKRGRLTPLQVRAIRADKRTHRAIAQDYGVSAKHIGSIKNRDAYRRV